MIRRIGTCALLINKVSKPKNLKVYIPTVNIRTKKGGNSSIKAIDDEHVPPPPSVDPATAWEEVRAPEGIYWWNTVTDGNTNIYVILLLYYYYCYYYCYSNFYILRDNRNWCTKTN